MELHSSPFQRAVLLIRQTEDSIISHPGTQGPAQAPPPPPPFLCSMAEEDKTSCGDCELPGRPQSGAGCGVGFLVWSLVWSHRGSLMRPGRSDPQEVGAVPTWAP